MAKKKIAILGGGMAGLSAAYQLTRTPELQAQHDVTVYQLGWRLGGKAASSRDRWDRNLEHGLHVWFGCYHNMFATVQEVYAAWDKPPGCVLQRWQDIVAPQPYTPLGVLTDGGWTSFPLNWPTNPGIPGQGGLDMTLKEALTSLFGWFRIAIRSLLGDWTQLWSQPGGAAPPPVPAAARHYPLPDSFLQATAASPRLLHDEKAQAMTLGAQSRFGTLSFAEKVDSALLWIKALENHPGAKDPTHVGDLLDLFDEIEASFEAVASVAVRLLAPASAPGVKWQVMGELVNLFGALVRGYLRDLVLPDKPFEDLDGEDLRAWLLRHGAKPDIVRDSCIVRAVYDTMFQFVDGDVARASYAAGSALGVLTRIVATFKGSVMWNLQAGMGEAVVAPLYEVLKANGVQFRFFRKVRKLEVANGAIARVQLDVQAKLRDDEYQPTYLHPQFKFFCWPAEPDWSQLEDGARLRAAGVNFESHWCQEPPAGTEVLQEGTDFDEVVLSMAMGAYKPLNADPSPCADLIAASGAFADFVGKQELVPSQGLQLWANRTPQQLGWTTGQAAMVAGPEYLDIFDDMSQVLRYEGTAGGACTVYYLTGTFKTQLYKQPISAKETPQQAQDAMRAQAVGWLEERAYVMWPEACDGRSFRWDVLADPNGASGPLRLDGQFLRVNIDPTECCVASVAGTTQYRLLPRQGGFSNLVLAGEATRHGFNTTTIEGAVMSGMAAARAICGQPAAIVGYDFLRTPPSQRAG